MVFFCYISPSPSKLRPTGLRFQITPITSGRTAKVRSSTRQADIHIVLANASVQNTSATDTPAEVDDDAADANPSHARKTLTARLKRRLMHTSVVLFPLPCPCASLSARRRIACADLKASSAARHAASDFDASWTARRAVFSAAQAFRSAALAFCSAACIFRSAAASSDSSRFDR